MFQSRLATIATLSIVLLVGVTIWTVKNGVARFAEMGTYNAPDIQLSRADALEEQEMLLLGLTQASNPNATSKEDPIEMISPMVVAQLAGQYAGIVESGAYSPEAVKRAAEEMAPFVKAAITHKTYSSQDFKTDSNTSYERMLEYRNDLRTSLAPLLENTRSELEIFAEYIETEDPQYLEELQNAAKKYREASKLAAALTIPRDAVIYHRDVLNALEQFAATLDAMASHATDPLASVALLRSYNSAESNVFASFDALARYNKQKLP